MWEKSRYLQVWESNPYLLAVAEILKTTISYGYYTKPQVYDAIGYNGPMAPNLPSWYNPGPTSSTTTIKTTRTTTAAPAAAGGSP